MSQTWLKIFPLPSTSNLFRRLTFSGFQFVFIFAILFLIFGSTSILAQGAPVQQEVPQIILSINDIKDYTFDGFRNFELTTSGIVDVQNLPNGTLRVKAIASGTTFMYVWDSKGRSTLQFQVTGLAPNAITNFRPGYNPSGNEFIYHSSLSSQYANGQWISPFWNQDLSSSVPFSNQSEWRTILHATTNSNSISDSNNYAPFSSNTSFDQVLSYYKTRHTTIAAGDVSYDAGELSLIGFPLRGGSFQLYSSENRDQLQVFGGLNRPEFRSNNLFNDPSSDLLGIVGTKELFPNVSLRTSFLYLNQPTNNISFPGETYQNDYVADAGIFTHPLSEEITVEGEFGKSKDDNAYRGLVEYRPYWGRMLLSFKQIGENYVNPSTFFLLKNYRETNFITEYQPTKKLGFNFDYGLSQFGDDPGIGNSAIDVNSFTLNSIYQKSENTTYVSGINVIKTFSDTSPQEYEKADFIYQRFYRQNNDQFYAEFFGQHSKQNYASEFTSKAGGGVDTRYTKNFSRIFQMYLQNELQISQVHTNLIAATSPDYVETILTTGPALNYILRNKTLSGGFFYNLTVQGAFDDSSNLLQPFVSFYYNPSQALSVGTRVNYNQDFGNNYYYLQILAEMIYRFGSRVPDTILSTFIPSAQITGIVFIDSNGDGQYESDEKLIQNFSSQLNNEEPITSKDGTFTYKPDSGKNTFSVSLPPEYKNYQFSIANPVSMDLFSRENKTLYFGISQRIALNGKVIVYHDSLTTDASGFEGAKIQITGNNFTTTISSSSSGVFNVFVPTAGTYHIKLFDMDLPVGYKSIGSTDIDVKVQEGRINKLPSFILQGKRIVIGRAFYDTNGNGIFDENEKPAVGIKVNVGNIVTTSESDGTFSISPIAPGTYYLKAQPKTVSGFHPGFSNDKIIIPEVGTVEVLVPYEK